MKNTAEGAIVAVLELAASERPQLLDFHVETLLNSQVRLAVLELAAALDVPPERLAATFHKACLDLDELEKLRKSWRDPA